VDRGLRGPERTRVPPPRWRRVRPAPKPECGARRARVRSGYGAGAGVDRRAGAGGVPPARTGTASLVGQEPADGHEVLLVVRRSEARNPDDVARRRCMYEQIVAEVDADV